MLAHSQQWPCFSPEHIFQASQEDRPHVLCDKSHDTIFKTGMGEALGDFKSNQCPDNRALLPPASTAKFLFQIPGLSSDKQPSASTGWSSLAPWPRKHPSGNWLRVSPRLGCVGRGGRGCGVWGQLRPSCPQPLRTIFSIGRSVGHPAPSSCPLPWADVCSISVSSRRGCRGHAVTLPAPREQRARPRCSMAPATPSDTALQHPQRCRSHESLSALAGQSAFPRPIFLSRFLGEGQDRTAGTPGLLRVQAGRAHCGE